MDVGRALCCISHIALLVVCALPNDGETEINDVNRNDIPAQLTRHRRGFYKDATLWPYGLIPYAINGDDFNDRERADILRAMAMWSKHTCIKFRPANHLDKHFVNYRDGKLCFSVLGMDLGYTQNIFLNSSGCRHFGMYLHEIGHAIGLVHEHGMPDRDLHLDAKRDGMMEEKLPSDQVIDMGLPYDLASIMHYGRAAGKFRVKDQSKAHLALDFVHKKNISFGNAKEVNTMYKCAAHCRRNKNCVPPGFLDKRCRCQMPGMYYVEYCQDWEPTCKKFARIENSCLCDEWVRVMCPLSCRSCTPREPDPELVIEEVCENSEDVTDTECQIWASNGHCLSSPSVRNHCRKTCGKCGPEHTHSGTCTNQYPDELCESWAREKVTCPQNSTLTRNCSLACHTCPNNSTKSGDPVANEAKSEKPASNESKSEKRAINEAKSEKPDVKKTMPDRTPVTVPKTVEPKTEKGKLTRQTATVHKPKNKVSVVPAKVKKPNEDRTKHKRQIIRKETSNRKTVNKVKHKKPSIKRPTVPTTPTKPQCENSIRTTEKLCDSWSKGHNNCKRNSYVKKHCRRSCGIC